MLDAVALWIYNHVSGYPKDTVMELLKVARWGNSLAIRIPSKMAKELGLKEGDAVSRERLGLYRKVSREEALAMIQSMQREMPKDWKVDRDAPDTRG